MNISSLIHVGGFENPSVMKCCIHRDIHKKINKFFNVLFEEVSGAISI